MTIPIEDSWSLEEIGVAIKTLGIRLEIIGGGMRNVPFSQAASIAKDEIADLNVKIRKIALSQGIHMPRSGPRPSRKQEHSGIEEGTSKVTSFAKPLHLDKRWGS